MERNVIDLSFGKLVIEYGKIGDDIYINVRGGDHEHIGCAVMAVPRPSLSGDGTTSCTSSVLNLMGHKDEEILRPLAESFCRKHNVTTVCVGGFHIDDITDVQIQELRDRVKDFMESDI